MSVQKSHETCDVYGFDIAVHNIRLTRPPGKILCRRARGERRICVADSVRRFAGSSDANCDNTP
jgi:hypothetical protein